MATSGIIEIQIMSSGTCYTNNSMADLPKPTEHGIGMLLGKRLIDIFINLDKTEILFIDSDNCEYKMFHSQECCEYVCIDDIEGDLKDLIGSYILQAEESTNRDDGGLGKEMSTDSFTWTFYKLATQKGYVTIRWLGESNGYYSETVDFIKKDL